MTRNWKRFFPLLEEPELFDTCDTWCCFSLFGKVTRKGFDVASLTRAVAVVLIVIGKLILGRDKDKKKKSSRGNHWLVVYRECAGKLSRGKLKTKSRGPRRAASRRTFFGPLVIPMCVFYISRRFISRANAYRCIVPRKARGTIRVFVRDVADALSAAPEMLKIVRDWG